MTEDGASVDSVTGELATRLGAVGGHAGEAMRRGVRDAAGGAQTIALLVQADTAAAQHLGPADIAASTAPGDAELPPPATLPPPAESPPPGELPPPADRPVPGEKSTVTGAADHDPGSADRPTADASPESTAPTTTGGAVGDRPDPDPEPTPHAAARAHPLPGTTPESPETAPGPPAAGQPSATPVPAADDPPRTDAAVPPGDPITAAAGHTPWTPAGTEQASGHTPGSTPWNSGTGSSMPYAPGMPGGLGSLTPQERPPRGSAPWSRGRGSKEETVFPRPRSDRSNSTNRTEWAPP
ncbi:hypothetical protein [Nocardia rhamnosiphila]|uniref:hypothetical protein n=1 Tax=Nocardia rhamnosiphila TaxID=426716 RepID=UPI0004C2FA10|nr:hypothetical protein [Nocardia rhamnosiphila]